ncbi:putative beta-galactosidase [Actinacidiphila reveromycinica]|uniref:Putative beta-galactosidase n=2 Tax=Actinacidiphila reveromycinica TaxID=659352 RepID=A0A7U3UZK2_9ACTN|nr:glycoside hydrolase family 2 TIM barrel-domain containing protein [Streptomyces sp. SN-593]BBB01492.1 putative beta-galactosidase [Streptomyces sp. SN-593]
MAADRRSSTALPRTVELADGWRFALVDLCDVTDPTGAYARAADPDYDDSGWRAVRVPHDWSIEQTPTTDHHTTAGGGFLPGGLGWYRTAFTLPEAAAGRRVSIEFDGVYMDSDVHCNGVLVGNHPYGYTGFAYDITDLVHTDGRTADVVAVQVRNRLPSSRWYSGSGINRHARLVLTDPVHVARHGVHVTTPDLADALRAARPATVRAQVEVVNETGTAVAATVVSTVRDRHGRPVARARTPLALTASARPQQATAELLLDQPELWAPATPGHRYTLETAIHVGDTAVDTVSTRFGLRHFTLDPDRGLFVNGEPAKLQGVNLHHDQGALGAVTHHDALLRQLTLMKSMGANAVRTAHNPPAPVLVRLCEELGLMLVIEAFDCWRTGKCAYDYGRFFDAHHVEDVAEMVRAARNSPAVLMWSIGNEIPDTTATEGLAMADGLIAAVRAHDTTRPIVVGSDKYQQPPPVGSPADLLLAKLDGLGLNYNSAATVDELHARHPHLFLFESESSSATATRGTYQDPQHLNTGENHTPGRRAASSFDNNLARWTMSGEYALKKDRDRAFFAGQFLWAGIDYIGEPTPYKAAFPVKASFFGAVDTAGFPKDMYHLYRSQWTTGPMVHLVPMDWTDHEPGETVEVWAYSTVDTVELRLNGRSLGVRRFDAKKTADGRGYLETTEPTGDDKTVTAGPYPGSYTSPHGGAGKLHLTWRVPFAPGELTALALRGGEVVTTDVLRTAGRPHAVRLTPDRPSVPADGDSLVHVTADVVDSAGVTVPSAGHLLTFAVTGGSLAGLDNGQQDNGERYQATTRTAFHGKALAIVRSGTRAGELEVTASAPGLLDGTASIATTPADGPVATTPPQVFLPDPGPGAPGYPLADASYSGAPTTLPAAMLDGDPDTGWSNAFTKAATGLLPAFDGARRSDWVSVAWERPRTVDTVSVHFTVDAAHSLPAEVVVSGWDGERWTPVPGQAVTWATGSDEPTLVTFPATRTARLRLDLTSAAPGTSAGAQRISALDATAAGGSARLRGRADAPESPRS